MAFEKRSVGDFNLAHHVTLHPAFRSTNLASNQEPPGRAHRESRPGCPFRTREKMKPWEIQTAESESAGDKGHKGTAGNRISRSDY